MPKENPPEDGTEWWEMAPYLLELPPALGKAWALVGIFPARLRRRRPVDVLQHEMEGPGVAGRFSAGEKGDAGQEEQE